MPGRAAAVGRQAPVDLGLDRFERDAPLVGQEPPDRGAEGDRRRIGQAEPVELVGGQRATRSRNCASLVDSAGAAAARGRARGGRSPRPPSRQVDPRARPAGAGSPRSRS